MRGMTILPAIVLLAACDRQPTSPPVANHVAVAKPVAKPAAEPAGCADGWTVALDPQSFANNGADRHFASARLGMFRDQLESAVRGAVDAACGDGEIASADAKAVKRVIVHSASGAADPTFSGGDDPSALRLEWVFAEEDLTIPSEMELRGGLVCWSAPESDQCTEREP